MADEKEVFLNLEKQANDIISDLTLLKTETSHYSNSAKSLDDSVKMIETLITALEKHAEELTNVSRSIREGGLERLQKNLDELTTATKDTNLSIKDYLEKNESSLTKLITEFTNTNTSISDLNEKTDTGLNKLTIENDRTNTSINHLDQKLKQHSNRFDLLFVSVIIIAILQVISLFN